MSEMNKRAVPVKMIWMFITLGIAVSWLFTILFLTGGAGGRNLLNSLYSTAPMLLLEVGAAICLAKGTLNLALPGTACLCASMAALICRDDGNLFVAIAVAAAAGTALGAINGLFSIQSRKKAVLVTGIASLITGSCFLAIAGLVTGNMMIAVRFERGIYQIFCWIGIVIAATVCILSALGGESSPETGEDEAKGSGGIRFIWTMIAGTLAGLGGAVYTIRTGAAGVSAFSGCNEFYILPVILLSGMLIPNLRRSMGESILAMVSVILAGLSVGFISTYLMILGVDAQGQRLIMGFFSALLLIPNILIGRGRRKQME